MKKTLLALVALTALGITSVMAAPVSYQSVLTGKVASTVFCWRFCNRRSNIGDCRNISWPYGCC